MYQRGAACSDSSRKRQGVCFRDDFCMLRRDGHNLSPTNFAGPLLEAAASLALTCAGAKIRGSASNCLGKRPVRQEFWGV